MRRMIFFVLPLLAACSGQTTQAVDFRNPATGEVASVCGPLTGMQRAVTEAREGCMESYKNAGWIQVPSQRVAEAKH